MFRQEPDRIVPTMPDPSGRRGNKTSVRNCDMALTDTKLKALKPGEQIVTESDGGRLYVEVLPTGKKR